MADEVRGSRLRRAVTMTGAAAGVAARTAGGRALARTGSSDKRQEAANRQQIKAAHQLVRVLGGMRGAAMKVGQTLSAVDLGLVPEELRPEMQEILAELQHSAKPVSFTSRMCPRPRTATPPPRTTTRTRATATTRIRGQKTA